jgi:hypothetical protein
MIDRKKERPPMGLPKAKDNDLRNKTGPPVAPTLVGIGVERARLSD